MARKNTKERVYVEVNSDKPCVYFGVTQLGTDAPTGMVVAEFVETGKTFKVEAVLKTVISAYKESV
jgi:glycine cleavage system H lipoate-binding protein